MNPTDQPPTPETMKTAQYIRTCHQDGSVSEISRAEVKKKLAGNYKNIPLAMSDLDAGTPLRTPFATYSRKPEPPTPITDAAIERDSIKGIIETSRTLERDNARLRVAMKQSAEALDEALAVVDWPFFVVSVRAVMESITAALAREVRG